MTAALPAVSPKALPFLESELRIEVARWSLTPTYARLCGNTRIDLERQIEAACAGATTWTDTAGTVWGYGNVRVGGTVPTPGGNSFTEPLGY